MAESLGHDFPQRTDDRRESSVRCSSRKKRVAGSEWQAAHGPAGRWPCPVAWVGELGLLAGSPYGLSVTPLWPLRTLVSCSGRPGAVLVTGDDLSLTHAHEHGTWKMCRQPASVGQGSAQDWTKIISMMRRVHEPPCRQWHDAARRSIALHEAAARSCTELQEACCRTRLHARRTRHGPGTEWHVFVIFNRTQRQAGRHSGYGETQNHTKSTAKTPDAW